MTIDNKKRWKALITYRRESGYDVRTEFFEEIEELHGIVEAGPDWNALKDIVVTLNRRSSIADTIEAADILFGTHGIQQ